MRNAKIFAFACMIPLLAAGAACNTNIAAASAASSGSGSDASSGGGGPGGAGSGGSAQGGAATGGAATGGTATGGSRVCGDDVAPPNEVLPDTVDPEAGMFTLDEALAELPAGPGPLRAVVTTEKGELTCTLFPDDAPNGVANFVGLARGRRAWKDPKVQKWVHRAFYDGLTFHRIIDNFVAQGGDPLGTGFGGPGYKFPDEISAALKHDPGTLAYANSGPNTNGSQFYITETAQPSLDGGYTIIGHCDPIAVVQAITAVPTDANDKPLQPIHTLTVKITRCAP